MPIDYTKYPENWFTELRPAVLKRANYACEECGLSNGKRGYRDAQGKFVECDEFMEQWAEKQGIRVFRIVLTIAHLDHIVDNNSLDNLRAKCQKCHLNYDRAENLIKRKMNAALRRRKEWQEKRKGY